LNWKTLSLLTLLCLLLPISLAQATAYYTNTNFHFGFGSGSYLNFNATRTFTTHPYESSDYWYFDGYGFNAQNGNVTITDFFSGGNLFFTVTAPMGNTSTINVYVGAKGNATEVWGATSWNYNATSKILSVTRFHTVAAMGISVFWYPTSIYGVEVVVGGIIAVGSGSLLFWRWRRKVKSRTVSVPP
jgi:hypothetical protein